MSQATINSQLIAARQRMNWTQSDACEAAGVPDIRSWQRWEQEGVMPNPYYRRKLCTIFSMSIDELGFTQSAKKDASIIIVETEQKIFLPLSANRYSEEEDRDWTTWFGVKQAQLFTMISAWSRQAFLHDEIQTMVDQEIKMMDETLNQYEALEK